MRELIDELARLQDAARGQSTSWPRPGPDPNRGGELDRVREAEHRVIAELRRRRGPVARAGVVRVWQVGMPDAEGVW